MKEYSPKPETSFDASKCLRVPDRIRRLPVGAAFKVGSKNSLFPEGLQGYEAGFFSPSPDFSKAVNVPRGLYHVVGLQTVSKSKFLDEAGVSRIGAGREVFLIKKVGMKYFAFLP